MAARITLRNRNISPTSHDDIRIGDMATCVGPPDVIALGSFTVLIGDQPAARIGDMTIHGGVIVLGAFTVMIGG